MLEAATSGSDKASEMQKIQGEHSDKCVKKVVIWFSIKYTHIEKCVNAQ